VTHVAFNGSSTRPIVLFSVLCGLALAPELASATVLDNFGNAVLGILNNAFLRAIAIVAVIGTGLMALSGRIQWMSFIIVMLAVVIIFGSAGIVDYIKDNAATAAIEVPAVFAHVV
jgi:type IV secretory pathway VirB2 component (pilin)